MSKLKHIGVFDSGLGGLTVMRELVKKLPNESIVYFGDTARVPYGGKSPETISRYTIESAIFLMEQDIKLLVIACNTASAYALEKLQKIFNIPVIGVIEPGAETAVQSSKNGNIAVLGTKATVSSGAYEKALQNKRSGINVTSIACPLFVPLVEEHAAHPAASMIAQEYLKPLKSSSVDTVLLGCTHYPILKTTIQKELGDHIQLVDSASTCAEEVCKILDEHQLHTTQSHAAPHKFFVSDDPEKFSKLGEVFFGAPITNVQKASLH